ncbi:MAG TPA: DUF4381 family protein [Methylomirabilota bacterium]|jgi:hypothetical protein|nr:DUF4381 family protein [Methylomirabilota bacterium]
MKLAPMTLAALLLTLALAAAAPAAEPGADRVVTRVPPLPRLTVGDRFPVTFVVTTRHPSLVTGPLADSLGAFVIAKEERKSVRRGDLDETTYKLAVACFRAGRQTLPGLRFTVSFGEQGDTLIGDTVGVTIASVLPDSMKDVRGLKPAETFPNYWLWLIPAILVLVAVLAWLGWKLYRRLKRLHEALPPPLPAWEEALGALDRLPWREWLADGQLKRLYYALSEILKRYLERRFEFDAVEQTTTELLASMRAHKLPMRDEISRFFARCDLVKYAKTVPPEEETERALEQLRDFVQRTKPAPAPAAPAATTQPAPAGGGA